MGSEGILGDLMGFILRGAWHGWHDMGAMLMCLVDGLMHGRMGGRENTYVRRGTRARLRRCRYCAVLCLNAWMLGCTAWMHESSSVTKAW